MCVCVYASVRVKQHNTENQMKFVAMSAKMIAILLAFAPVISVNLAICLAIERSFFFLRISKILRKDVYCVRPLRLV